MKWSTATLALALAAGPYLAHAFDLGDGPIDPDTWPQGNALLATDILGLYLSGQQLGAADLDRLRLASGRTVLAWVDGSRIELYCPGTPCADRDILGASFEVPVSNGRSLTVRIDGYRVAPRYRYHYVNGRWVRRANTDADADIAFYELSYNAWQHATWTVEPVRLNPCPDDGMAILVRGAWNDCEGPGCGGRISDDGYTIACKGADAVAKCVHEGKYKPWDTCEGEACQSESMADYHQACTRMLRSDYCGFGVGLTEDGTLIHVTHDMNAPQPESPIGADFDWGFEAGWGPDGATCLARERFFGTLLDPDDDELAWRANYVRQHCDDIPRPCSSPYMLNYSSAFGVKTVCNPELGDRCEKPTDPATPTPIPSRPGGGYAL